MAADTKQYSFTDYKFYAAISGDVDTYTARPARAAGYDTLDKPARGFMASGAGDIEVRPCYGAADGSDDQTFTLVTGVWYPFQFKAIIDAGTTATNISVGW